jgi:hypothetical protein
MPLVISYSPLMALSFGIYPEYLVVPFLPISAWRKGEVAMGLSAVSWGMFFVGSVLVGKKGVAYLTAEREVEPLLLRALPRKRTSLP